MLREGGPGPEILSYEGTFSVRSPSIPTLIGAAVIRSKDGGGRASDREELPLLPQKTLVTWIIEIHEVARIPNEEGTRGWE